MAAAVVYSTVVIAVIVVVEIIVAAFRVYVVKRVDIPVFEVSSSFFFGGYLGPFLVVIASFDEFDYFEEDFNDFEYGYDHNGIKIEGVFWDVFVLDDKDVEDGDDDSVLEGRYDTFQYSIGEPIFDEV